MGDEIPASERLKYLNEIYDGLHYDDARRPQIAKQIEELNSIVNPYYGDPYYPDLWEEYGNYKEPRYFYTDNRYAMDPRSMDAYPTSDELYRKYRATK